MNLQKIRTSAILCVFLLITPQIFAKPKKNKLVNKTVYISVEEIALKSAPSLWGKENGIVFYGDELKAIDYEKSWLQVKDKKTGKTGWVKETVVTTKKLKSRGSVFVNAEELALAGKGFGTGMENVDTDSYGDYYKYVLNKIKNSFNDENDDEDNENEEENSKLQVMPNYFVDKIESCTVSEEELKDFIIQGNLKGE